MNRWRKSPNFPFNAGLHGGSTATTGSCTLTDQLPADPERALTIAYAPAEVRAALAALWRLDERLGAVVAATREDRLGEIRLAWWREALTRLDAHAPPDEPILQEAAAKLVARGIAGHELGEVADGWAALLVTPLAEPALLRHARERGEALFRIAARLLGGDAADAERIAAAGHGWALVDVAFHVRDTGVADRALDLARRAQDGVAMERWSPRLRPLGALDALARDDAAHDRTGRREVGSPRRVLRVLRHRLTGR